MASELLAAVDELSLEDDLQDEEEEDLGIPSIDEPFIQKYLDGRDALIAQEKQQRTDHAFREYLSPMASEACSIISAIRFEEQETLWNPTFENNLAATTRMDIHPGMMFSLAKERMESSKLFKIVKKMPKGALLHCHLEGMGDIDWLIEEAFNTEGMHIKADAALDSDEALSSTQFLFQYAKPQPKTEQSIWNTTYQANTLIPISDAASSFANGGKAGFVSWLKNRVTITHEESILHHQGPHPIWQKFLSCFAILASIQHYEPIFRKFIRLVLKHLHEDGVKWVDIRALFIIPYYQTESEVADPDYFNLLLALQEEIENFKATQEGMGFWGARLIWTAVRRFDSKQIALTMRDCIDMKLEFPELIAGFDLVGHEDLGQSLAELTPELFWFKKQCAQSGVDIPFYFHAGETLGDGNLPDENLFDAILLGTRRIGHAFSLYKHPLLVDMVKDKKILVESCPISNEILRLTGSIMSHPLPALIARGVHCSLSNDDPAILGQGHSGMTHDFCRALEAWDNLGLAGLASLAENSIRWATFDDCTTKEWNQEIKEGASGKGVRAERMKEWAKEFEKFCQWVVFEYATETDRDFMD